MQLLPAATKIDLLNYLLKHKYIYYYIYDYITFTSFKIKFFVSINVHTSAHLHK